MGQTPNHEYNVPEQGTADWHVPLNENFEAFDVDVEIRDSEANRGDYEPTAGAKFLATDTGVVFLGDGESWVPQFVLAEDADGDAQFHTLVDAPTVHADTVVATHLQGDLTGGANLTTLAGNNLTIENGQLNASGDGGGDGGAWEQVDAFLTPTDDAIDGVDLSGNGDRVVVAEPANARSELRFVADGTRAVSLGADTDTDSGTDAGNVVHGYAENRTTAGVVGATIGGGGRSTQSGDEKNEVYDDYGTVGGGAHNRAGSDDDDPTTAQFTTIAGGLGNTATEDLTAVGGGKGNAASGLGDVIGGGTDNTANGGTATIAGGNGNAASGTDAAVGGGLENTASGSAGAVAGGSGNTASGTDAAVGGGQNNTAGAASTTVGGGEENVADGGGGATVGGGIDNEASDVASTVCGGQDNAASGTRSIVGGGIDNEASGEYATVGGGRKNDAEDKYATIAGGGPTDLDNPESTNNDVWAEYGTIGGGGNNTAGGPNLDVTAATVAGGADNTAERSYAVVGGGFSNDATGKFATVAGGSQNEASAEYSTACGGFNNTASAVGSTVSGGQNNEATGSNATVSGGADNTASDQFATVPGGTQNEASGAMSFAAGFKATAQHDGAVVFGDSTLDSISSSGAYEARFQMPVYAPSFNTTSARAAKTDVESVDSAAVLAGVESLDVQTWEFTDADDGRHMGPMAGDFYETFGLGADDGTIAGVDRDGVALAAIQALSEKLDEKDERIADLEAENEQLRDRLAAIEDRIGMERAGDDGSKVTAEDR